MGPSWTGCWVHTGVNQLSCARRSHLKVPGESVLCGEEEEVETRIHRR